MNLVDSSGWLEWLTDGKNADQFAPAILNTTELLVSSINLYEVYKKVLLERDEQTAVQVLGLMQQGQVVDVDTTLAVSGAQISQKYKLPLADSLIYATAQRFAATLWTQDADFKGLAGVEYFPK